MRSSNPPRLASWLVERLTSGPHRSALIGDLLEAAPRHSWAWYWRQVLSAIAASVWRDARAHRWMVARALSVGWVGYFAGAFIANALTPAARNWAAQLVDYDYTNLGTFFLVTRGPSTLLAYSASFIVGWLVGRTHRHLTGAWASFTISVFVVEYGLLTLGVVAMIGGVARPLSAVSLFFSALLVIGRPLFALSGALLGSQDSTREGAGNDVTAEVG